ncbi:MAG: hypothetical protein M3O46_17280 [Myxococcota bacterium]|nr:hypothetical protein [Myxococcota bacterium]
MTSPHRSLWGGAIVGALMLAVRPSSAETPPAAVDIIVAGRPEAASQLENAVVLGDRLVRWAVVDRMTVSDVVQRPSESGPGATRAWIDCSRSDRVRIYFANWNTERFMAREVPLPDGFNEVALETLGQVMETSLSALTADAKTGMSRAEMASVYESEPDAESALPPQSSWGTTFGAFYAVQVFASEHLIEHGPGLTAALGQREGTWRPAAWLSAQYQFPETINAALIGVRLDTLGLRGGVQMMRGLSPRVALGVRGGAGADMVHISPRQGSAQHAALSPERFSWESVAQLALLCSVRVGPGVVLSTALLADADLASRHYDVIVDGSTVRALTPWNIRPGLMAGVSWP